MASGLPGLERCVEANCYEAEDCHVFLLHLLDESPERVASGFVTTFCVLDPYRTTTTTSQIYELPDFTTHIEEFIYEYVSHFGGLTSETDQQSRTSVHDVNRGHANSPMKGRADTCPYVAAYLTLIDYSLLLNINERLFETVLDIFRVNWSRIPNRNRQIDLVLSACIYSASRAMNLFSLTEISKAASVDIKDIARISKSLVDLPPPSSINSDENTRQIMGRFSQKLGVNPLCEEISLKISQRFIGKADVTRSNTVSICAASLYLGCIVGGEPKSQSDISLGTNISDVTIRKIFKEMLQLSRDLVDPPFQSHQIFRSNQGKPIQITSPPVVQDMTPAQKRKLIYDFVDLKQTTFQTQLESQSRTNPANTKTSPTLAEISSSYSTQKSNSPLIIKLSHSPGVSHNEETGSPVNTFKGYIPSSSNVITGSASQHVFCMSHSPKKYPSSQNSSPLKRITPPMLFKGVSPSKTCVEIISHGRPKEHSEHAFRKPSCDLMNRFDENVENVTAVRSPMHVMTQHLESNAIREVDSLSQIEEKGE